MIVDHERARRRDRKEYLCVRFDDPDVRLPEGPERGCLASVRRPDGDIAFLIERRADQILVLGVDGEREAVISRPERGSGGPRIELPDGTLLAEVTGTGGRYGKGVRAIAVPDGTEVGQFGKLRSRRWALRLFVDHSPALTNAVIAYLFTAGRS
ncbi:hypothetical protein [Actinomadura sp. 7K507]|uniref:hypothetical protein n=1 Tax=Actinomadura sp. 7K507 TaxID=2530365 RepID=UPI0010ECEB1A|nr:hypothetical protein [Actinomadura sp. 7K507]TDC88838.1 hypothetical protein E1285_17610 [Actinomadura sp. 7K507]